jgi:threonine aldolase
MKMQVDLRSDTVTKPTPEMLEAITQAEVGDDVFEEDPTVTKLQEEMATLFGHEAGLFVPSGTMSNQLGVHVLTQPGDELLIDHLGHIYNYETAAASHLSSVAIQPLQGHRGKLSVEVLKDRKRGAYDWEPNSSVLCLENTTNKGGGATYSEDDLDALYEFAQEEELAIHMDGARIWNAITATGIDPEYFGSISDTMSICFSKGLGAPVGSMLLSSEANIQRARRMRKMWGGGMRQVGLLAAAAHYAVEHHWPLLKDDHRRAKELAATVAECERLDIDPDTVESNIVIFEVHGETAVEAVERLGDSGVMVTPFGPQTIRATFHHQIGDDQLAYTQDQLRDLFN